MTTTKTHDWKAELKRLKLEHIRGISPGFFKASGGYTMKVKSYTDRTANGLAAAICDWVKFHGGDAQRINTTGMMRKVNGEMKWTKSGSRKGCADVHAIIQGRAVSIEIKIGRDQQSEAQVKEQQRVEAAGGLYVIARNMDEFVAWYRKIFIKS